MDIKLKAAINAGGTLAAIVALVGTVMVAFTYVDLNLLVLLSLGTTLGMMVGLLYQTHLDRLVAKEINAIVTRTRAK